MAVPQGWNESSGKYESSPYYLNGDASVALKLITDPNTGNFTVADASGNPIYSVDADGGIQISNVSRFTTLFDGADGGDANLAKVNQFIKKSTLDIAGDLGQDIKENLEQQQEYKSLSNTEVNDQNDDNNSSNELSVSDIFGGVTGAGDPKASARGEGLRYPNVMRGDQDYIMFTSTDRCNNDYEKCSLPIQGGIADNNAVDWAGGKLGPIQGAVAELADDIVSGRDVTSTVSDGKAKVESEIENIKSAIGGATGAALAGVSQDELLSRFKGAVINPNLQLLFKGPTLRPFAFTFTLTPRSRDEATMVRRIIRFFKFNMAIQKTSGQLFLEEPRTFKIRYVNGDSAGGEDNHQGLNRIKRCALQACNVEYTPAGTYSRFNDDAGTMTQYKIGLQFQEIQPIYSEDYDDANSIGF